MSDLATIELASRLIRKAVDPGCSAEEARTTALIACQKIASMGGVRELLSSMVGAPSGVDDLLEQLAQARMREDDLQACAARFQGEVSRLMGEIARSRETQRTLSEALEQSRRELSEAQSRWQEMERLVVSLQAELDQKPSRRRTQPLREEAARLKARVDELEQEVSRLRHPVARAGEGDWVMLESRYSGRCCVCSRPYAEGDTVFWKRGSGVRHKACHTKG